MQPLMSFNLIFRFGLATFLLGSLFGCATLGIVTTKDVQVVTDSVQAVGQKVAEVQRSVDELNLSQGGTTSKMRADLTSMLGDLKDQISRLQAEIDETQHRLGDLSNKLTHLEQRKIVVTGDTSHTMVTGAASSPNAGKGAPQVRVVDGLDLEHVFNQAREDYVRGKYDLSYSGFKTIYEKDAGGSYKELALYWMGECLYKGGKTEKALDAYERSLKEFSNGSKACTARFKIGLIHHEAKALDKRNDAWQALIQNCQGSNEAERAKEMMKE